MVPAGGHQDPKSVVQPGKEAPHSTSLRTRRDVVRNGVKLASAAPVLSTFFAEEAYATNYSCYPAGHACNAASEGKRQACCEGLTCSGDPGICQ